MTAYTKAGSFGWAGGGKAGALVDLWATSRFAGFPVQNQAPPSGNPDAGPVTTGANFGNPGAFVISGIPTVQDYYIRVQYGGETLWGACPAATLGGVGGGGGTDMPIANPTGITQGVETPDSISGSDSAKWVQFPSNASVMAWGIAGDAFPRVVFGADPTATSGFSGVGWVSLGDGTFDPVATTDGGTILADTNPVRGFLLPQLYGGPFEAGATLGQLAFSGINLDSPIGAIGAEIGDLVTTHFITGGTFPSLWRCTTRGDAAAAVWTMVSVIADTDPITANMSSPFSPPNAGILWQDFSGSGSLWISTGTSSGDWTQVWPLQQFASAPSYVKGGMYFDTTLNKLRIGGATAWETVTSV